MAEAPEGAARRISGRELAIAALTAGQLGDRAAGARRARAGRSSRSSRRSGRGRGALAPALRHRGRADRASRCCSCGLAAVDARLGRRVRRLHDRPRRATGSGSAAGSSRATRRRCRSAGCARCGWSRACCGARSGSCALTVEVTGYAEEASAARTLFPLVRVREVRAFLDEFLPELADDVGGLERPPARAARRYLLPAALLGAVVTVGALVPGRPVRAARAACSACSTAGRRLARRGLARCATAGSRSARMRIARVTVLAPARLRESHTVVAERLPAARAPRRLSVAFGKSTARIRHSRRRRDAAAASPRHTVRRS